MATQLLDAAADNEGMNEPYRTSEELVDDHIAALTAELQGEPLHESTARVLARMQATKLTGVELPLLLLETRLGLTDTEMRVLWLLLGHELDPAVRALIRAQNTEDVPDVTYDAIRRFVYGSRARTRTWAELGPDGPLRSLGLIVRTNGDADAPEQRHTFKVARRVLALAHGHLSLASELATIARLVQEVPVLPSLEVDRDAVTAIEQCIARGTGLLIANGRIGSGRRSVLAACVGRPTLVVDGRVLASERNAARTQLRTIAREVKLLGCIPLIRNIDAFAAAPETADRFDLIESELEGLVLATSTRAVRRRWAIAVTQVELMPLTGTACARLWRGALPEASEADAEHLATMYPISPALIRAAADATRSSAGHGRIQPAHIEAGIRSVLDDRLAGLATRVVVTQRWEDLVLPDDQITAVAELLARIRERRRVYEEWGFASKVGRGLGIAALFSGEPGTGKTMAAGLIAQDLGCEIYQVDTSKIASKWIGETEKNLAALFDAAEAGHAILLFDEADTLFGKRTDVKSSNDRHANHEVNYLLQRVESYTGICILTTNHESAIDEAFRRRLAVHVRFPMPEAEERAHIWQSLLPMSAPVAKNLGIDALARTFVMSGGHIRNAVLRAAFLAANDGSPISGAHLLRAARLEYEALGKVTPALVTTGTSSSLYG